MRWIKLFASREEAEHRLTENKPQLLIVDGKRICLVKREQALLAVSDTCTHNGESLSKGTVNYLGEIICPWHGYQFNLSSGREFRERSTDLAIFPIRQDEEGVFIGL